MAQIPQKILIDTNILIHLEDNKEIGEQYSELNRLCSQYGISIHVHESSYQDILRDKDEERRKISLSKLEKYPRIHRTPRTKEQKEALYGAIKKENDEVDTDILVSLSLGAVDLVVTQDVALKARVKDHELHDKVKNVDSTLTFFKKFFGAVLVDYKHVQDKFCNQYHHDHPFFDSLKGDYKGEFEGWYERCMGDQRPCWVIEQEGGIAGLIIYKDEDRKNPKHENELNELGVPGNHILKLSLFKVDPTIRGEKFGEQLLKKAMDYAYRNEYDATYLTVFPKHTELINLISKFGFQQCGKKGGEQVYFKYTKVIKLSEPLPAFDFHKLFWPCTKIKDVDKFCVPIRPEFHQRLFPESAGQFDKQLTFFSDPLPQTPGNAIRKVYICNSQTATINAGSLLLFYRSGDSSITSVGVLQEYRSAKNFEEIKTLAGKRSVYSDDELLDLTLKKTDAKVMNFYYAENFIHPISLKTLKAAGVLKDTPQSITKIPNEKFDIFLKKLVNESDRGIFYE